MSLGLILVIILVIVLFGGLSEVAALEDMATVTDIAELASSVPSSSSC